MLNKKHDSDMLRVPLWKKMNLTVEEAAVYSGIGVSKIKEISNFYETHRPLRIHS